MSQMTKKEFLLLQDAVNTAVDGFLNDSRLVERGTDGNPTHQLATSATTERVLRENLAVALSAKLKYTNDGFQPEEFSRAITTVRTIRKPTTAA
jgi:hypothetical protein